VANLLATVKLVALFGVLGATIGAGLLFGLNYQKIADRYSVWYMRRRERSAWYRSPPEAANYSSHWQHLLWTRLPVRRLDRLQHRSAVFERVRLPLMRYGLAANTY